MDTRPAGSNDAWFTTLLAPIAWGTTYWVITELLPDGRPLLVAVMRVVPAGALLVLLTLPLTSWRPRGRDWFNLSVLAACNFAVFLPLLAVAVYRLPGGVAAAVGGLQPLLVLGLSRALTNHRPQRIELLAGVVAVIGVSLVVIRPNAGIDALGVLAAVAANVSFSLGVVLTRRLPAPPHRLAATGWQLLLAGVVLVPLMFAIEGMPPAFTGRSTAGFAYLSLVSTAAAYVLWFRGIKLLPTVSPPLLGLAAPITGAIIGWAALGQSLSPTQLVGFVVTLGAIAYGALRPAMVARRTVVEPIA